MSQITLAESLEIEINEDHGVVSGSVDAIDLNFLSKLLYLFHD